MYFFQIICSNLENIIDDQTNKKLNKKSKSEWFTDFVKSKTIPSKISQFHLKNPLQYFGFGFDKSSLVVPSTNTTIVNVAITSIDNVNSIFTRWNDAISRLRATVAGPNNDDAVTNETPPSNDQSEGTSAFANLGNAIARLRATVAGNSDNESINNVSTENTSTFANCDDSIASEPSIIHHETSNATENYTRDAKNTNVCIKKGNDNTKSSTSADKPSGTCQKVSVPSVTPSATASEPTRTRGENTAIHVNTSNVNSFDINRPRNLSQRRNAIVPNTSVVAGPNSIRPATRSGNNAGNKNDVDIKNSRKLSQRRNAIVPNSTEVPGSCLIRTGTRDQREQNKNTLEVNGVDTKSSKKIYQRRNAIVPNNSAGAGPNGIRPGTKGESTAIVTPNSTVAGPSNIRSETKGKNTAVIKNTLGCNDVDTSPNTSAQRCAAIVAPVAGPSGIRSETRESIPINKTSTNSNSLYAKCTNAFARQSTSAKSSRTPLRTAANGTAAKSRDVHTKNLSVSGGQNSVTVGPSDVEAGPSGVQARIRSSSESVKSSSDDSNDTGTIANWKSKYLLTQIHNFTNTG